MIANRNHAFKKKLLLRKKDNFDKADVRSLNFVPHFVSATDNHLDHNPTRLITSTANHEGLHIVTKHLTFLRRYLIRLFYGGAIQRKM